MNQDFNSLITGLATGIEKYMGLSIEQGIKQGAEDRKLSNDMKLKEYDAQLDLTGKSALETYKLTLEGKVDPDTAMNLHPRGAAYAMSFEKKNGRPPTVTEFEKGLKVYDDKAKKPTGAQNTVDREFGKEYARYVAGGGYADTISQIQTLEGVVNDLKGGKSNLTGGGLGMLPDAIRKRTHSNSMAAQQSVEQSVQRSLKQTLGGQFTEKEGALFMQRGYDPSLPEAENAKKLDRAIGQLKSMALAKQRAVDYYEENGSLTGFKGEFYTLKGGVIIKASKDDFYKMIGEQPTQQSGGSNNDPLGLGI
jgi:hypothetical protein